MPLIFPSAKVADQVAQELYDTTPEVQKETSDVKFLYFHATGPGFLNSRTKPIKTIADFKGLKIRADRHTTVDIVKQLGGVPVSMMMSDIYEALSKGELDAVCTPWSSLIPFKFTEVTKYRTMFPQGLWLDLLSTVMNRDVWNKLSPDVQKIFTDTSGAYMSGLAGDAIDKSNGRFEAATRDYDKKVGNPDYIVLTGEDFQNWQKAIAPVNDMWVDRMNAKGLPGKAVLDKARSLGQKYSH